MKPNFLSSISSTAQQLVTQYPSHRLSHLSSEVSRCNQLCSRSSCEQDCFLVDEVNQRHPFVMCTFVKIYKLLEKLWRVFVIETIDDWVAVPVSLCHTCSTAFLTIFNIFEYHLFSVVVQTTWRG